MYTKQEVDFLLNKANDILNKKSVVNSTDLKEFIRLFDWSYYVKSESLIADFDYDLLFKLLKKMEAENPELITADSPTQRVAAGLTTDFTQVAHLVPMLSLENS